MQFSFKNKISLLLSCIVLHLFLLSLYNSSRAQVGERTYRHDVLIHLEQGSLLLEGGQYKLARAEFLEAIKLDPRCPDAYNNLGLVYFRTGDLKNATQNYMKALEYEPLFIPSLSNLAAVRYQQGRYADAANLYRMALKIAKDADPQLHYNLANVLRDNKDYSEARYHYEQAIKQNPDFAAAHNGLGATLYCLSDFAGAEKEVRTALDLKKGYSLAYYHLGLILSAQDRNEEALSAYEQSIKFEKNKAYADDTRKKINALRIAMKEGSTSAMPQVDAGRSQDPPSVEKVASYLASNQFAKAEADLADMVKGEFKDDPSAWNSYGYAMLQQKTKGKYEQSIDCFKKAIQLSKGELIEAHYNLTQAYMKTGRWMSAKNQCQDAISKAAHQKKMCPLVHNLHGIILKHGGDLNGARDAYNLAILQSQGSLPVAHYNKAIVLEKLNNPGGAATEYKNYLRNAPQGVNASRAKKRLAHLSQ